MNKARIESYALSALSGLMLAGAFAPFGRAWLAWAALAPLLYAVISSHGPAAAARRGAAAGLVFYCISLSWMPNVVDWMAPLFWCIFALWPALFAALSKALYTHMEGHGINEPRALLWTLAAGLNWAGLEYFRSELWPLECPWLCLGYSQAYSHAVYQTLSVWGVYGLSALIAACGAAIALLPRRRFPWLPAAVCAAALVVSVSWGRRRLETQRAENGRPVKVALVQAENSDIAKLARLSLTPEAAAADLLVWPEYSVYLPSAGSEPYIRHIAAALKRSRSTAVIGAVVMPDKARGVERANFTLMLDGAKKPIGRYDKMHPVQFVESGLRGNRRPAPVDTPAARLAPQICYDLAFEDGSRLMARQGGELLVTPTLDPAEWGELQHRQHSDMTSARAVETGLWAVRAASSGWSQVVDRFGFTRAELAPGREGALCATAWAAPGGTFYTRYGWLFAPLAFLFLLASSLFAFRERLANLLKSFR